MGSARANEMEDKTGPARRHTRRAARAGDPLLAPGLAPWTPAPVSWAR